MEWEELALAEPPPRGWRRDVWLQHAAGRIFMEHVRGYALERVDARCSEHERSIAVKAIDDALYGLMMMIDGVAPGLGNRDRLIVIRFIVQLLAEPDSEDELVKDELNLFDGESMCGTYHMWMEGDYGADPIIDVGHSGDT